MCIFVKCINCSILRRAASLCYHGDTAAAKLGSWQILVWKEQNASTHLSPCKKFKPWRHPFLPPIITDYPEQLGIGGGSCLLSEKSLMWNTSISCSSPNVSSDTHKGSRYDNWCWIGTSKAILRKGGADMKWVMDQWGHFLTLEYSEMWPCLLKRTKSFQFKHRQK